MLEVTPTLQAVFYSGLIVAALSYIWSQWRGGKNSYLEKTVKNMNELLSSQDKKIADLQTVHEDNSRKIVELTQEVEYLKRTNSDISAIMKEALVSYFQNNPEKALTLSHLTTDGSTIINVNQKV